MVLRGWTATDSGNDPSPGSAPHYSRRMRTLIGTLVGLAVFAAVVVLALFVGAGGIGEVELAVITVIGALVGYLVARRVIRAAKA